MCYFHLVRVVHPFTVMMEDNGDGFLVAETCWGFSTFKMKKLLHLSLFFLWICMIRLKFMDLYANNLSVLIPQTFGNLTSLTHLSL